MRILIADDDAVSRLRLEAQLTRSGHEVVAAADGDEAWSVLQQPDAPRLAILDWMMPGLDGVEVCRKVRERPDRQSDYLILLTSKDSKADIVTGLDNGANDYITKPFDASELRARIQVGVRVLELERRLAARVRELEVALGEIDHLRGLLPICMYCKKIRNDENYWEQVDQYLGSRAELRFSHGICPDCWKSVVEPELQQLGQTPPTDAGEDGT